MWRDSKMHVTNLSRFQKPAFCVIPMTFWERQNYGENKNTSGCQEEK